MSELSATLRDQLHGVLLGVALGDALGTPYEFRYGSKEYTSILDAKRSNYISDDTEMMIALCHGLVAGQNQFNRETVIIEYVDWANTDPEDMGYNTRNLFYHPTAATKIDKVSRYNAAYREATRRPQSEWTQSNGALMRCAPLAFLPTIHRSWILDALLSNPHPHCLAATEVYFRMIHHLLNQQDEPLSVEWATCEPICQVIEDALQVNRVDKPGPRNVSHQRGWCCHALYFACIAYHYPFTSFTEAMNFIIGKHLDSDADTNAAIAGAILGARFGLDWIRRDSISNSNLTLLLSKKGTRPSKYHPSQLPALAEALMQHPHTI